MGDRLTSLMCMARGGGPAGLLSVVVVGAGFDAAEWLPRPWSLRKIVLARDSMGDGPGVGEGDEVSGHGQWSEYTWNRDIVGGGLCGIPEKRCPHGQMETLRDGRMVVDSV
jgi:hypothetical protein